jgi:hypothetical protein
MGDCFSDELCLGSFDRHPMRSLFKDAARDGGGRRFLALEYALRTISEAQADAA